MKNTYNIEDAQASIKELNDYLVELGREVQDRSVRFNDLEKLMSNPEFIRLMSSVRFFNEEGNRHMAEVYGNLAKAYNAAAGGVELEFV